MAIIKDAAAAPQLEPGDAIVGGQAITDFVNGLLGTDADVQTVYGWILRKKIAERDNRIAELERATGDWSSVPRVTVTSHRRVGAWLLDLNSQSRICLTPREHGLVTTVSGWVGPLTPKMRAVVPGHR